MENGLQVQMICDQCNTTRALSGTDVHKGNFIVNSDTIQLMYFDCQVCGKRHFVQVDNMRTLSILRDVISMMAKLMTLRNKNKPIPQKQSDKFKRKRKHLAEIRNGLMRDYQDKPCKNIETGEEFILRFTIC